MLAAVAHAVSRHAARVVAAARHTLPRRYFMMGDTPMPPSMFSPLLSYAYDDFSYGILPPCRLIRCRRHCRYYYVIFMAYDIAATFFILAAPSYFD